MALQTNALADLGDVLRQRNLYLTCAESCTGGLLGHLITNVPGSSDYFLGGFMTYSNQAKEQFLGVNAETLQAHGAVSRETVLEMALGARMAFQDILPIENILALSTSGIAGPGGGSSQKPVGTVWVGFSSAAQAEARLFHFQGTREEVKLQSVLAAIQILKDQLKQA